MPMDYDDMDKDMDYDDMDKMDKSMRMMDKMMGGPEALMMMIGMTAVTYGLKLTRWVDADKYTNYTINVSNWELANTVSIYGEFTLSVVAILPHVAAMATEDQML